MLMYVALYLGMRGVIERGGRGLRFGGLGLRYWVCLWKVVASVGGR